MKYVPLASFHASRRAKSPSCRPRSVTQVVVFLLAICLPSLVSGLKFELQAAPNPGNTRCFSQYLYEDTMGLGEVSVEAASPGQTLSMVISDDTDHRNQLASVPSVAGEQKFAFRTHDDGYVLYCFTNRLHTGFVQTPETKQHVHFSVDTGHYDKQHSESLQDHKINPVAEELKRLEGLVQEVQNELDYLANRESAMRDVNESTNDRVKWFNILSFGCLLSAGAWQIFYLRKFFQSKKLI